MFLKKVLLSLFVFTIFLFGQSTELSVLTRITGISKLPNSYRFVFAVEYTRYKDAKGIAAFPNGGVPKVYLHRFIFYDANALSKKAEQRLRIEEPWEGMIVRAVTLGALDKEGTFYADVYGIVGKKSLHRYIKIDKTGNYHTIDRTQMHWAVAQEAMFRKPGETRFLRLGTRIHPTAVTAWTDDTKSYTPERFEPIFIVDEATGELVQ